MRPVRFSPGTFTPTRIHLLCGLVLAAVCWYIFGDAVRHGFTFDDEDYIANAELAHQNLKYLVLPAIDKPWASRMGVHLYAFLVYPLFGETPAPYHLVNVLFHLLNALLLMNLVRLQQGRLEIGFVAALLFLVNTMPYQAVISANSSLACPLEPTRTSDTSPFSR